VLLWTQEYREALCETEGLAMPVSLLTPVKPYLASRVVVYLDDGGRRAALEAGGPAAQLARLFEPDPAAPRPALVVADLPGRGDSEPGLMPFATAGWGSRDRMLSYLSVALGDGILAIQVRAAVALVEAAAARLATPALHGGGVALVGRGLAGAVALLAAALSPEISTVVSWSSLAAFGLLAESERYDWPAAAFMPNVLREIDLPELAGALAAAGKGVLLVDPLDAERRPLGPAAASELYGGGAGLPTVLPAAAGTQALAAVESFLYGLPTAAAAAR